MAGVADYIALTGQSRLKRRIPFLMRIGASVGGAWMTKDVLSLVILYIPGEEGAGAANCNACGQEHSIRYGLVGIGM